MFSIRNAYPTTVWAMFEWHHPGCADGGDWEKKGWWRIEPGQTKVVYGGDLTALRACSYWYARAGDGVEWSGAYTEFVPPRVFDWCSNTSSSDARRIGMRETCTGNANNWTLTLNP